MAVPVMAMSEDTFIHGIFRIWNESADSSLPRVTEVGVSRLEKARRCWEEFPDPVIWRELVERVNRAVRDGTLKEANVELLLLPGAAAKILSGLYDPPEKVAHDG